MALAIAAFLRVERPQSLRNLSGDLVSLAARLPDVVQVVVVGSTQLASIAAAVGMIIVVAIQRRWRVVIPVFASGLAAGVLTALTTDWVSRTAPGTGTLLPRPSWIIGPTFPSAAFLSAVVAAVVTASPTWSRSWRRAAWVAVGVVSLSRILTAATVPVGIGASVLVGMTVGSAVLYLVGIPRVRVATSVIRAALEDQGLLLDAIVPTDAESTSEFAYSARDSEGAPIDVFLVDRRDRDADLFARVVRSLKVKDVDADQAGLSPSRIVEHAALAGLMARSHGISVRAVRAVGSTADGDGFIAYVGQDRDRLVDLDRDELDHQLLRNAWGTLLGLHDLRIAHRRANLTHVLRSDDDPTNAVLWSGLRYCAMGASNHLLSLDIAELLTSTTLKVGINAALDVAVESVPRDDLISALPVLQPAALSAETRRALSTQKGVLAELRAALQERLSVEEVELAPLQRITGARILGLVLGAVVIYAGLSFASDWSQIAESFRHMDWSYMPILIALTALTYPAMALSMQGAIPMSLPLAQATEVILAQTILNRFTPANAGGMAMRLRYLQRLGLDIDVGAASLGLSSAAGGVAQVLLMVVFAIWAGSSGTLNFELPTSLIIPVVAVVLALCGVIYLTPFGRRLVSTKLVPSLKRTWPVVRDLLRSPGKLALLLTSNIAMKVFTIATFGISAHAIGIDLSAAQVGLLYLTANTVASAAPTPGGLGAMEAALTAALTSAGAPPAEALSAVLIFRLVSFWLPIPFSAFSLQRLRRKGVI